MEVHDVTAALLLAAGKIPEVKSVGFDPTSPETSAAASFMIVTGGEENWRVTVEGVDQRSENPTSDGRT